MKEILDAIKTSILEIEKAIKFPELGYTNSHNKTGDTQLKLDVKSDEIITKNLSQVSSIKAIISEEKDEILTLNENAEFIVAYDPLDGSSLVDVNFAVGSIFGIYRGEVGALNLVASAYSVYGPRLEMVVCGFDESENKIKTPPTLYRVDENSQFIKIKELVLNEKGKLNATGGSQWGWGEKHKLLVKTLFDEKYRLRYSGAMVADLHQILLKGGGLFSYPATSDSPNGKLRVTFEILPFAYIFESAGGTTSDGVLDSLLELEFSKIHSTSPCFFGSKYEIEKMHEIYGLKG